MKRGIPSDELPYIYNTDVQVEYRFPLHIDTYAYDVDVMVLADLNRTMGRNRRILNCAGAMNVDLTKIADIQLDVYLPTQHTRELFRDPSVFDDLTRTYDIINPSSGLCTLEMMELCCKNRCLIVTSQPPWWDSTKQSWVCVKSRGSLRFVNTPTCLMDDHAGSLVCGTKYIHPQYRFIPKAVLAQMRYFL